MRRVPRVVGRRVGRGRALRLACLGGRHVRHPSDSMSPTLLPGDKVRVDKTVFGARLYTSLDFTDGRMESIRTGGRRGLRYNDIVVFNYPVNDKGRIGFKMNYVYVKRVVALPGDTISFVHSRPVNSHCEGVLGLAEAQRGLEETPDSLIPWYAMRNILVETAVLGYTIKEIPPVYVPRRGDILRMDDWRKAEIYRRAIEWETGRALAWDGERGQCLSDGRPCRTTVSARIIISYAATWPTVRRIPVTGASFRRNTSWAWWTVWWSRTIP